MKKWSIKFSEQEYQYLSHFGQHVWTDRSKCVSIAEKCTRNALISTSNFRDFGSNKKILIKEWCF